MVGRLRAGAATLAALTALSFDQRAAAVRGEPLHILCSGPPGSIPDLVARAVGDQLFVTLGQRVVVDNRPDAAGQISVGTLKAAAADGSTLLLAQGAIATVYPYLFAKLAYDPAVDLQPVTLASEMLLGLAVGSAVPGEVTTLADFVAPIADVAVGLGRMRCDDHVGIEISCGTHTPGRAQPKAPGDRPR